MRMSRAALAAIAALVTGASAFTFHRTSRVAGTITPLSSQQTKLSVSTDAEARAAAAMEADDSSSNLGSVGVKLETLMESGGRPFPLSMVVGQDSIKQALLLAGVNNRMVGLLRGIINYSKRIILTFQKDISVCYKCDLIKISILFSFIVVRAEW